jgi:hypothetical protein
VRRRIGRRDARGDVLQVEHGSQGGVDLLELVEGQPADGLAKTGWIDHRRLLGQYGSSAAPSR